MPLLILRHSLAAPKLMHTLRSSPCAGNAQLDLFDTKLRAALSLITNTRLDDLSWLQASLPVQNGGLGVRSVGLLAPSAFLASAAATHELQARIAPRVADMHDPSLERVAAVWQDRHDRELPLELDMTKQACLDQFSINSGLAILNRGFTDDYSRARLLACQAPHSGDWLNAWPITACGLRLDNEAIRVAVGLRLGVGLCDPYTCICGARVDERGSHGPACRRSTCRIARHDAINDIICRTLLNAKIPCRKEPAGLLNDDNKRPDGITLIPWGRGRCMTWDVTISDTLANSHLARTSLVAGAAAEAAALLKIRKYDDLLPTHDFCPVAIETLGPINEEGLEFLSELGKRASLISGDPRETAFLFQRISVAQQRWNAIAFHGTFVGSEDVTE